MIITKYEPLFLLDVKNKEEFNEKNYHYLNDLFYKALSFFIKNKEHLSLLKAATGFDFVNPLLKKIFSIVNMITS